MKKFDKRYIFYHLFSDFFIVLVLAFTFLSDVIFVVSEETEEITAVNYQAIPYAVLIFAAIYLIFAVYRILYQRFSGYELTDTDLRCKRGVLFRKSSVLEYRKIHAINKKQNIFHKLFGIAVLTVDSGSTNTAHQAEIIVVERGAVVDALLDELHSLREGGVRGEVPKETKTLITDGDALYKFTSPKKFLYSAISIATTAFFVAAFGIITILLIGICLAVLKLDFLGVLGEYALWSVIILLGATLLSSVFAFIGTIIQSFVGYYNFKIEKKDNDIIISYGLLERHTNTFSYDRIRGVKITQGLIQRALGFAEIKLEVIGYMSESDGNNAVMLGVLIPFCKYSEISEILDKILPEYKPEERESRSPKLFPYISWFSLILGTVTVLTLLSTIIPLAILKVDALYIGIASAVIVVVALITFLMKLASSLLAYNTAGITANEKKITAYSGGFIKQITVLKTRDLSSVEEVTTPLRARAGITTAVLHMRTNSTSNEVKVPIQEKASVDKALAVMPD